MPRTQTSASAALIAATLLTAHSTASGGESEAVPVVHVEAKAPEKIPPNPDDIHLIARGRFDVLPFSETDIGVSHGLSEAGTTLKNQYYFLKASIAGTSVERRRVKEHCRRGPKTFKLDASGIGCAFIELEDRLNNDLAKAVASKSKTKDSKKRKKSNGEIRTIDDWNATTELSYTQALNRLNVKTLPAAIKLSQLAIEGGCKTAVAGAALTNQLEDFLPEAEAWSAIDNLYATIAECLDTKSPAHEQLHLRVGLLNLLRGRNEAATDSLNRALKVQRSPEEFRTLFWRGYLESQIRTDKPTVVRWNPFWDRLVKVYPLTQHAVLVHALFGEHPVSTSREKEEISLSPYASGNWDAPNLANFIFLNLLTRKETRTAKEFSRKIEGKVQTNQMEPGLILAHSHLASGNLRESMRTTYSFMKDAGTEAMHPDAIRLLYPVLFEKEIERHAKEIEVPFVMSLIRQESSFNSRAESPKGAVGLMQVLPNTARSVSSKRRKSKEQNLFEPDANIAAGCRYLGRQLESFDGNEILTLSAYNAGPTNANRWTKRYSGAGPLLFADLIPFPETRAYVSGILRGRFWYRYLTGAFDKEQQKQNELLYAEHLLASRLQPNLASRGEKFSELSLLARPLPPSSQEEEPLYQEPF